MPMSIQGYVEGITDLFDVTRFDPIFEERFQEMLKHEDELFDEPVIVE